MTRPLFPLALAALALLTSSAAQARPFAPPLAKAKAPPAWTLHGPAAPKGATVDGISGDGFSYSCAAIGDLFNDGGTIYAVGAPFLAHGAGNGAVFVYRAQPGAEPPPLPRIDSNQANCGFGQSVSPAGDVNGDGYPDLLVGAPTFDVAGHPDAGRAYLYLGNPTGFTATPSWQFDTGESNAQVGMKVAYAGDVNKDGYDDWLVSAPYHTNGESQEGVVYLFLGGAGALSTVPAWTQESDIAGAYSGWSIGTAGDVNGDGYADILVGAPYLTHVQSGDGAVWLFLGAPGGPSHTAARTWYGADKFFYFGSAVSTIGDMDGDGYADFAVGSPGYTSGQTSEGAVYVYHGASLAASILDAVPIESDVTQATYGSSVGPAGDINGDGLADFIVGAPNEANGGGAYGSAYVYYGNSGGVPNFDTALQNLTPGASLGTWVGTLGDFDGDGRSECAAGVLGATGAVAVLPGAPVLSPLDWVAGQGMVEERRFGMSAAALDADGDGYDDLVAGTPEGDDPSTLDWSGVVHLFRGGPKPFPSLDAYPYVGAAFDWSWNGAVQDSLGQSVANGGDVNGDGYEDLIVGAPGHTDGQPQEGQALLFYGSPSGPANAWKTEGNQPGANYGTAVAGAGDVNRDGYGDVAVGAPTGGALANEGTVAIYTGAAAGLSTVPAVVLSGGTNQAFFGQSVALVGDVDRDGFDDLVVGAPGVSAGEGRAYLYRGSATGIHAPASQVLSTGDAAARFGTHVSRVGDVNRDGYADVGVTAPRYSDGVLDEGKVMVFFGGPAGLAATPGWALEGGSSGRLLGRFPLRAGGDMNGDGYPDLLLADPQEAVPGADAGGVHVYFGTSSGPPTVTGFDMPGFFPGMQLGWAAVGDADFDGDGATDLAYTAPGFGFVGPNEGVIAVRLGNHVAEDNADRAIVPWRTDGTARIATGLRSNATTAFRLKGPGRSAAGRTRVRLEWEVKPLAAPFDLSGRVRGPWQSLGPVVPGNGTSAALDALASGLAPATAYRWRVRTRGASPYFPSTPWSSASRVGVTERMLRTAGGGLPVAVDPAPPAQVALAPVAPNPSAGTSLLAFALPQAGPVLLSIHDVHGRLVKTLLRGPALAGASQVSWNGADERGVRVPAGAYFVRLSFGDEVRLGKLVRL
jgi:hypothetical protein